MNFNPSPAVTPFIPPLPSPGGHTPSIPNPQVHDLPSWATHPQTAANFPMVYPGTPYTGTPYIPPMDGFSTPAAGPSGPPGSYFPPPTNLPPQTPYQGTNGFSSDYTGYPTAAQWGAPPTAAYPNTPYAHPPMMQPQTGYNPFQQPLPGGWGPQAGYAPQPPTPWGMPGMPGAGQWQTPWPGGAPLPGGQGGHSGHPQQQTGHPQQQTGHPQHQPARGTFQGLSERFHLSRSSDESDLANKVRFSIGPHCRCLFLFAGQDIDAALFQTVPSLNPFW